MCPSSGAARALLNIPKPARVRTSERMEQSDMFLERNEWLSTEAKRRRGTVSGSYTQLPQARVCRTENERRVENQRSNNEGKRIPKACEADGAMAYYSGPSYR